MKPLLELDHAWTDGLKVFIEPDLIALIQPLGYKRSLLSVTGSNGTAVMGTPEELNAKIAEFKAAKEAPTESLDDWVWFDAADGVCPLPNDVLFADGEHATEYLHVICRGWHFFRSETTNITHYGIKRKDLSAVLEWQKYNLKPKPLPSGWIPLPEGLERMPEWVKGIGKYLSSDGDVFSSTTIWGLCNEDHVDDNVWAGIEAILPLTIPAYEGVGK